MTSLKTTIIRGGLETLYFSGANMLMRPFVHGVGVILTLHHVRPQRPEAFQPNRLLEVTPEFLERVVRYLRRRDLDVVSLDEVYRRLVEQDFSRRFVCITIDDGYRDTLQWAYPILKRHDAPFAVYIPTSFPDRLGELWWLALEAVVARNSRVTLLLDRGEQGFECATVTEKRDLFDQLYRYVRSIPTEEQLRVFVRDLCGRYHVDIMEFCNALCMDWNELTTLAADPLVTIGAHTVNHIALGRADEETVRAELTDARAALEAKLKRPIRHLAYPYGDAISAGPREYSIAAELGYTTALTTRPGMLFPEHGAHLTALPRIAISGEFQRLRYVDALVSGAPTALWNRFRRLQVA